MVDNTLILIISITSFSSLVIFCGCIKYCKDMKHERDKLNNTRRKLMTKNRIKPISLTIIDEEIKSKSEIRLGEENV